MLKSLTLILFLICSVLAQEATQGVLRGTWTAAAGTGMSLRGNWSAQAHPEIANAAYGSWTLVNAANRVILQGTWAAERSAAGWRGSWSAQTSTKRSFSGTWEAALADVKGGTVMEMLQRTLKEQIAGSWRQGALAGHWWLEGATR